MTANVYVILFICMYCRCWLVFGTGGPWRGGGVPSTRVTRIGLPNPLEIRGMMATCGISSEYLIPYCEPTTARETSAKDL